MARRRPTKTVRLDNYRIAVRRAEELEREELAEIELERRRARDEFEAAMDAADLIPDDAARSAAMDEALAAGNRADLERFLAVEAVKARKLERIAAAAKEHLS